jgi:hypothetical protein
MRLQGAPMPARATRLTAVSTGSTVFAAQLTALLALGLCREQPLLQIPNLSLRKRQIGKQRCLRIDRLRFELAHDALVPLLSPLRQPERLAVQGSAIAERPS